METKKKPIKKSEVWLVCWDDGGDDPVHKCRSFIEAKNYVHTLINEDGIMPEDIQVYKVLTAYKVTMDLIEV